MVKYTRFFPNYSVGGLCNVIDRWHRVLPPSISCVHHPSCFYNLNEQIPSSRWWFQIVFIFTPTWGRFPVWLIFFKWVETTNQSSICQQIWLCKDYNPFCMNPTLNGFTRLTNATSHPLVILWFSYHPNAFHDQFSIEMTWVFHQWLKRVVPIGYPSN